VRDIWILDPQGRRRPDLGGCGLATEVWSALYPFLARSRDRPLLARLWQEQWGAAADATLSPAEVEALAAELRSLEEDLGPHAGAASRQFLHDLIALCARARQLGGGLELVAD
jgi:hypothetical protein